MVIFRESTDLEEQRELNKRSSTAQLSKLKDRLVRPGKVIFFNRDT